MSKNWSWDKLPAPDLYRKIIQGDSVKRILAISSGGGHWVQLLRLRPAFDDQDVSYVTVHSDYSSDVPNNNFYTINDATRWDKIGLFRMTLSIFIIILKVRPNIVISTGAACGYISFRIAKLFKAKTIWIDSIANVEEISMTGKLVKPYADLWLTQWQELSKPLGPEYHGEVF